MVGLKSNPKEVPFNTVSNGPVPTAVAAPEAILIVYNLLLLPNAYNCPVTGRMSIPKIVSLICNPVIGLLTSI